MRSRIFQLAAGALRAYVLRGRALTAPVVALFEQHWATGAHYTAVDVGRDVSTERVRQVVALLARGMKDEAVARRLGVPTRTMRRLVAATMDELGAQSRFQTGIQAVRRASSNDRSCVVPHPGRAALPSSSSLG